MRIRLQSHISKQTIIMSVNTYHFDYISAFNGVKFSDMTQQKVMDTIKAFGRKKNARVIINVPSRDFESSGKDVLCEYNPETDTVSWSSSVTNKKMSKETEGWFTCLNAVAIEMECDKDSVAFGNLLNVMRDANITLDEVRQAQTMGFVTLDECGLLKEYEQKLLES